MQIQTSNWINRSLSYKLGAELRKKFQSYWDLWQRRNLKKMNVCIYMKYQNQNWGRIKLIVSEIQSQWYRNRTKWPRFQIDEAMFRFYKIYRILSFLFFFEFKFFFYLFFKICHIECQIIHFKLNQMAMSEKQTSLKKIQLITNSWPPQATMKLQWAYIEGNLIFKEWWRGVGKKTFLPIVHTVITTHNILPYRIKSHISQTHTHITHIIIRI